MIGVSSLVELRVLTVEDWRVWRALRLEALAEAPYAFGSRLADWQGDGDREERWRARLSLRDSHNLVATLQGRPAGMASGVAGDDPATAELISMWVSPFARGTGVADALVLGVERWARSSGARLLCLEVVSNNMAARGLYLRHGFADTGEVERRSSAVPGSTEDVLELRMVKPLDD
jgi:ribosomal protein S18 acetylase RimI-like enzyme